MLITPPMVYLLHAWYTTGGVLSLKCTTAALSPHGPRTGPNLIGPRGHGLGLSWKPSKSPNGPVRQETRVHLLFAQCVAA